MSCDKADDLPRTISGIPRESYDPVMSDSQDSFITPVSPAQLAQIAGTGIWASGTSVSAAAADVGEALVASLQGTATKALLTPDLQQLTTDVLRVAAVDITKITAHDGIGLSAHTIRHRVGGPRPVVIVPAGWTPFGWVLFEYSYLQLALRGYHVLAYTPRGIGLTEQGADGEFTDLWWTSGGTIDVAGPNDWQDGSTIIDYAQEYFSPSAIAFLGESYGSGISQLVAAKDEANRVSAVVALSTWGNLATSLLHHDTRHLDAVNALISFTGGPVERKFDAATQAILRSFHNGTDLDKVIAWGEERAPESYVDLTNDRGIPTFVSNTWHETLFPVNEVLDTFSRLTVPKHLNLWIGDHAAPEGAGLTIPLSGPSLPVAEAFAWLDHFLLGTQNGVPGWPQVASQVMFTYETQVNPRTGRREITQPAIREPSPSWDDVTTSTERWYLGAAAPGSRDGTLGTGPATGWASSFIAGNLTEATAVDEVMTTGQAEWNGSPKIYLTDNFDRHFLAAWLTPAAARRIRGIPRVHLTMSSTASSATLVAYLFDVDPDGTATIITHEPYTLADLTPDQDVTVDWPLQAAAYDIAADHRLMLVINSRDKLYSDASVAYSTTTIRSADGDASYLDLPLG
jgi:predicted acyl esterase